MQLKVAMSGINNEQVTKSQLPNSARYVLTYLKMRQLVYCEDAISFRDIVEGTGLSPRTVRKAISLLKRVGLLRVSCDIKHGRRNLYQLDIRRALHYFRYGSKLITPGIYLVDIGLGVRKFLSPRALAVILSCNLALITDSVPDQITELLPESTRTLHVASALRGEPSLQGTNPESSIIALLYDAMLDCDIVNVFLEKLRGLGYRGNIYYVPSVSPIDYALHLLELGKCCHVKFRRSPIALEIYVRKMPPLAELSNIVRLYYLRYSCREGRLELNLRVLEPRDLAGQDNLGLEDSAFIVYLYRS